MRRKDTGNLFIFFLVIVTLGVALYFLRPKTGETPTVNENISVNESVAVSPSGNTNTNGVQQRETYRDKKYFFSFKPSQPFTRESSSDDITTRYFGEDHITVAPESYESIITASLGELKEEKVQVSGKEARKIEGASAKDGSIVHAITFLQGGRTYYFQGSEAFLQSVIDTFQFEK